MGGADVRGAVLALMATIIYYLGFIVFRVAADRMPELRGTRPFGLLGYTYTNWLWLSGLVIVLAGVATQVEALTVILLSLAQPIFAASLVFTVGRRIRRRGSAPMTIARGVPRRFLTRRRKAVIVMRCTRGQGSYGETPYDGSMRCDGRQRR